MLLRPFTDTTKGDSPPLSLMYLSSAMKRRALPVKLVDNCVDRGKLGDLSLNKYVLKLLDEISEYNPDLLGMTLFSGELNDIYGICKLVRRNFKSLAIVLGGPHATALPDETLKQFPECDFVVRGEGEDILYELINSLIMKKTLANVRGLSFRKSNGENHHCNDADIIRNLDDLPLPDRESLLHQYREGAYRSLAFGMPADILSTSRGCPFSCHFCSKVCRIYRSRSAENVLNEIDWIIKNISPRHIQIIDDSFTIEKERCIRVLNGIIERKLSCRFSVRSRASAIDPEMLKLMKRAGVDTIIYGLESGSQTMLNEFNKKITVAQNVDACRMARKAGLNSVGNLLLFYPGENRETLKETSEFIKKAKPTVVKYMVLTPLPQTKIYHDAKMSGKLVGDWKVGEKTPYVKLNEFESLDAMENIARKMFLKAFLSPSRLFWIVRSFGMSFLRSPVFTLRMIYLSLRARIKY